MQTIPPRSSGTPHSSKIGGLIAAALTPFTEDLAVDRPRLEAQVAALFDDGCDYVAIFGTTGEGASICTETKLSVLRVMVGGAVDTRRLVVAVMETDVHEARRMIRWAADAGCRAVLVLPPFYYPAGENGIFDFFTRACGGRDPGIDVVLYHIPQLSRFAFTPDLIRRLGEHFGTRLAGIKDSTGVREHTLGLTRAFPALSIFTGTDTDLPSLLQAGGAGIIGGLPNINARGLRVVMGAAGEERDAAYGVASRMLQIVEDRGGISALKAIAARRYGDESWLRMAPPLRPLTALQRRVLLDAVAVTGYDLCEKAL